MGNTHSNDQGLAKRIEQAGPHDHLCLIYENQEEQFAASIPFIRIGLERGEKCLYIADDNTISAVFDAMRAHGIDVDAAVGSGALKVATKRETYLKEGCFDPDCMIRFLSDETARQKRSGYTAFRATGEMTWARGPERGTDKLVEYEAKLNYIMPKYDFLALCQYNRKLFSPAVIIDVIRTHPLVIYRGKLCRNPYYTPPNEFLMPDPNSAQLERLLNTMAAWAAVEESLREVRDRLTERLCKRTAQLTRINAALQTVIAECSELDDMPLSTRGDIAKRMKRQSAELASASEILLQEIAEDKSAEAQIRRLDENLKQLVTRRTVLLYSSSTGRN